MDWYTSVATGREFSSTLVTAWSARTAGERLITPDGCVDVLWLASGHAVLCGPETTPWRARLPPGTAAVGVRFRPGVAGSILGFDAHELVDQRVPVADLLGMRAHRTLVQHVGDGHDTRARVAAMLSHVRHWQHRARPPDPVAARTANLLLRHPDTSVGALAERLTLSTRQLNRRCTNAFGYGPATLRRILRLQRFLRLAVGAETSDGIAALACTAGYTDQAHLSHETRALAGVSPGTLVRGPMSDRYTPGLGLTGMLRT